MADRNYPELMKEKDNELRSLDIRWQADADLLYLTPYVMRRPPDIEGKQKVIPGVVNSTLNKPAVFGANVVAALGAVREQLIVTSETPDFDTTKVEEFLNAAFAAANRRLMQIREPQLNAFADRQFCFRGRAARRILFREENGFLVPDIMSWDGRYFRYQFGSEALEWGALEMTRKKNDIEAEYGTVIAEKEAIVLDVWDKEHNEVWIANKRVALRKDGKPRQEEHNYGFVPIVFQIVDLGYGDTLHDTNQQEKTGESIFFMIRDIVPQLNQVASIAATLNFLSVKRPVEWQSKEGDQKALPEYDEAMSPGSISAAEIGGGIKPIDFGDATRALQYLDMKLEKAIQDGSYTDIDIGNVRQPFSAVALITIGESKDQVYLPRLAAKELLNIATAEMIIKQCQQIGGILKFGSVGHEQRFGSNILVGQYDIAYKYFVKDPKRDIARMAEAAQAKEWYPRKYIYGNILQVEDPDGMEVDWYNQLAEEVSPNILKRRILMSLIKKGEDGDEDAAREAKIMAMEMGITINQMKQGIMPQMPKRVQAPGEPIVPLLPEGGRVGGTIPSSALKAGQLRQTSQGEEGAE